MHNYAFMHKIRSDVGLIINSEVILILIVIIMKTLNQFLLENTQVTSKQIQKAANDLLSQIDSGKRADLALQDVLKAHNLSTHVGALTRKAYPIQKNYELFWKAVKAKKSYDQSARL